MTQRSLPLIGAALALLSVLLAASGAAASDGALQTPRANDPLSLTPAGGRESSSPESAPDDSDTAGRKRLPTPFSESRPLPLANGVLDTRAVLADDTGAPPQGLAALDPRSNELVRVGGALAIVLGLLLAFKVILRRAAGGLGGAGRPSGVLEILARYPIARGQSLIIIKMARRVVLVHHAGTTMRTLSEVSEPDEVASLLGRMESGSRPRESERFATALRAFESEHARATGDHVEVVDLTRSQMRGLGSLLGRRRLPA